MLRTLCVVLAIFGTGVSAHANRPDRVAEEPPSLLLVCIDTLRPDHTGCYGYQRPTTPNLDRLAAEGVVFRNVSSVSSWTKPAIASVLTGFYPEAHRVENWPKAIPERFSTLAEVLRDAGYKTAGVVSATHIGMECGFGQGFDFFDDYSVNASALVKKPGRAKACDILRPSSCWPSDKVLYKTFSADYVSHAAIAWLEKNLEPPWFLFVHYWDVHANYIPHAPYVEAFRTDYRGFFKGDLFDSRYNRNVSPGCVEQAISLYDGEVAWTDKSLGILIDYLRENKRLDSTVVAVFSDHGDEFFEHGAKGHMKNLFQETVAATLVIRHPKTIPAEQTNLNVGSLTDVYPTLLDLLGVANPPPNQGRNLLASTSDPIDGPVLGRLNTQQANAHQFVRHGSWKWIRRLESEQESLFDLSVDPKERTNILSLNPQIAARLRKTYENWLEHGNTLFTPPPLAPRED